MQLSCDVVDDFMCIVVAVAPGDEDANTINSDEAATLSDEAAILRDEAATLRDEAATLNGKNTIQD